MATLNGSAKFFKWIAGGLAVLLLVFIQFGLADIKHDINNNTDSVSANSVRIDSLSAQVSRHLDRHDVDRAELILQMAAIAEKLKVPVVVDTVAANKDKAAAKDSIP